MAALFKRNNKTTIAELEEYYDNKKSTKPVMSWVMAFISILITVAIVIVAFLGARWVFQTISSDDNGDSGYTTSEESPNGQGTYDGADSAGLGVEPGEDAASDGVVSDEAASTSESNAGAVAGSDGSGNGAVAGTSSIPDTGAGDFVILIPVIAAVAGYLFTLNRQKNKS